MIRGKYYKLLEAISELNESDSHMSIRSIYAEYYVANELEKRGHKPILSGPEKPKPVKSHDIYLSDINKKIEVKSARELSKEFPAARSRRVSGYEWALGKKDKTGKTQQDKFDFLVLIGFKHKTCEINNIKDNKKIPIKNKKCIFIIGRNEYKTFNNNFFTSKYGVTYEQEALTKIEKDLEKDPTMHLEGWDKIKK